MIKIDIYLIKDLDGNIIRNFSSKIKAEAYFKNNKKVEIEKIKVELDNIILAPYHKNKYTKDEKKIMNWKELLYNHLVEVLESNNGNKDLSARQVGMLPTNFRYRLKTLGKLFTEYN